MSAATDAVVQDATNTLTRGIECANQPITKVVTITVSLTKTYLTSNITINSINNGSEAYYYNDTCYSGVIYSTSYSIPNAPVINGNYITFNLRITYQGTVLKKNL